jgi:hypothetical protein
MPRIYQRIEVFRWGHRHTLEMPTGSDQLYQLGFIWNEVKCVFKANRIWIISKAQSNGIQNEQEFEAVNQDINIRCQYRDDKTQQRNLWDHCSRRRGDALNSLKNPAGGHIHQTKYTSGKVMFEAGDMDC